MVQAGPASRFIFFYLDNGSGYVYIFSKFYTSFVTNSSIFYAHLTRTYSKEGFTVIPMKQSY